MFVVHPPLNMVLHVIKLWVMAPPSVIALLVPSIPRVPWSRAKSWSLGPQVEGRCGQMEKQNAMEMMKCVVILVVYEMVMSYGWFYHFSHNHGSGDFFALLMKGKEYWRHPIFIHFPL